jgi:hypothetical protein
MPASRLAETTAADPWARSQLCMGEHPERGLDDRVVDEVDEVDGGFLALAGPTAELSADRHEPGAAATYAWQWPASVTAAHRPCCPRRNRTVELVR